MKLSLLVLAFFAVSVLAALFDNLRHTGLRPSLSARLSSAFGGQYYTFTQGISVLGLAFGTFTHSLSITPALLFARVFVHQAGATNTGWPTVTTIGTNVVSFSIPVAQTATLLDVEVHQMPSLAS
jgi:hypothetical protein